MHSPFTCQNASLGRMKQHSYRAHFVTRASRCVFARNIASLRKLKTSTTNLGSCIVNRIYHNSGGRKRKLDHTTSPSSDDGATSRRPSPSLQSPRQPSPQQQQHGIHMGRWYASTPTTAAAPSLTKEVMHAREPVFVQQHHHHHHHHQHPSMPSPPPCTPSMAPQRHTLPTPASSHFEHPVSTPPPGLADYHYTQQHPPPQQNSMFAYHHNSSNHSDAPPLTPPSTLGDMSPRHSISTSNDRLPSLSAIIADSLPNTSRHLPAPIPSTPAFGTGRVPIHHLLQSHPF